jgi:hypothetical protein
MQWPVLPHLLQPEQAGLLAPHEQKEAPKRHSADEPAVPQS